MQKFPVYSVWTFGSEGAELFDTIEEAEAWVNSQENRLAFAEHEGNGSDLFFISTINDKEELDCFLHGPD